MNFQKKFLVAGSGISGIGAANLLLAKGADVIIYDGNEKLNKDDILNKFPKNSKVSVVLGELSKELADEVDLCVISPGIPLRVPFVQVLQEANVPIWSEIELAYQAAGGRLAAITGTNGKTTTTALVGEIFKNAYEHAFTVGNIGIPYTQEALNMKEDAVTVVECSSFQLETIVDFKPQVSAILNITPDHLDRHLTMENYEKVKEDITKNQDKDGTCVLNYEDDRLREFGKKLEIPVIFFSSLRKLEEGIFLDGEDIVLQTKTDRIVFVTIHELNIIGRHNYENAMAAIAIAYAMGVSVEVIQKTLKEFKAVEHRIEFVAEKNGVVYYNDSKGTNPDAAIKAIDAMTRPTILIAGGYDKGSDYTEWIEAFNGKVKKMLLMGVTGPKIEETAKKLGFTDCIYVESMEEAVRVAADLAVCGDAVLLSPACASWGMFKNYEQRGHIFKDCVNAL
ncbi:UDP-N-acetylmuramoylalanine--D-glutamate ligase [Lachnospiraceae bacterium TWA4]|nr:UDP-N-acetylmuramoylalanine--D-glutamate ligase [Lachnospiraceae bacterium TWA4]